LLNPAWQIQIKKYKANSNNNNIVVAVESKAEKEKEFSTQKLPRKIVAKKANTKQVKFPNNFCSVAAMTKPVFKLC
jgi:hypothetical protein